MGWQRLEPATPDAGQTLLGEATGEDVFPARALRVHLPAGYRDSAGPYPVLYLHDGENAYDAGSPGDKPTWGADQATDELAAQGLSTVIVAIDSGPDRIGEYSPWHEPRAGGGGRGAAYVDFIRRHVKPRIEADFAVRRDAAGAGSAGASLGALLSLFTVMRYPTEFAFCAALSPAIWYGSRAILDVIRERDRAGLRCYLDIGTRESESDEDNRIDIENAEDAAAALRAQGAEVVLVVEPDADHTERAWRSRFPAALAWFLDASRRPGE